MSLDKAPKPAPPTTDLAGRLAAAERELARARRDLYVERALRAFPAVEPVADLLTASDEDGIREQARRLDAHITR